MSVIYCEVCDKHIDTDFTEDHACKKITFLERTREQSLKVAVNDAIQEQSSVNKLRVRLENRTPAEVAREKADALELEWDGEYTKISNSK